MTDTDTNCNRALIVIDVQQGFDDAYWGQRNNPACEENVGALTDSFAEAGDPIVLVGHDSTTPDSPLRPDSVGNAFKPVLEGVQPALRIRKYVHSAFNGDVDLHAWLQERAIAQVVICGIQTNRCCETTARMAGDLHYDVLFAIDATHTFDEPDTDRADGLSADVLTRATAANLHGHFAQVVKTSDVVKATALKN